LVLAARELDIPSVELQHGVIGRYHIAYHFNEISFENTYLPDYIFTFGDYWTNTMNVPKGTVPISVGFPQMDLSKIYLKNIIQDDKRIVFYSSGGIGRELSQLAIEFAKISNKFGFTIKYKLHPSECKSWKILYPKLVDNNKIEVVDEPINVHELLASAKFHVGVDSTVLFEALAFNGVVFAYDIPGAHYMKDLIDMGYIHLFSDKNELFNLIKNNNKIIDAKLISENLFKQNAIKNIESEIRKIIKL